MKVSKAIQYALDYHRTIEDLPRKATGLAKHWRSQHLHRKDDD